MSSATILAEARQKGIPPPGCTDPPTKYKPFIFLLKLACRLNAENLLLELHTIMEIIKFKQAEEYTQMIMVSLWAVFTSEEFQTLEQII